MATIAEDYVSFETAKLLKEKGFQQLQNNCGYFTTEMVDNFLSITYNTKKAMEELGYNNVVDNER